MTTPWEHWRGLVNRGKALLGPLRALSLLFCLGGILSILVTLPQPGSTLEFWVRDGIQARLSEFRSPHPDICIVGIDDATLKAVTQRWPWPRGVMADLLASIGRQRPRAIVWDIVLAAPESADGGVGDARFEQVLRNLGNVILVSVVSDVRSGDSLELQILDNLPRFREAASEGMVRGILDGDGILRSFVPAEPRLGIESVPLVVLRHVAPEMADSFGKNPGGVVEPCPILFARGKSGLPSWSARSLIAGELATGTLEGRIVFVGATALTLHDFHRTPLTVLPGIEILAHATDTLLRGEGGRIRGGWAWRLAMGFLGAGLAFLVPLRQGPLAPLPAWAAFLVAALSVLAMGEAGRLFLPFAPLFLGWAGIHLIDLAARALFGFVDQQVQRAESLAAVMIQNELYRVKAWNSGPFRCTGFIQPCQDVGGDLLDIMPCKDGSVLFTIGDVTGHGISAALVGAVVKAGITSMEQRGPVTPQMVVEEVNRLLNTLFRRRNMTAVIGHLQPDSGALIICNAGHPFPYLFDTLTIKEVGDGGFPLGVRPQTRISTKNLILAPGHRLLVYTDGLVEARDWKGHALGYERWQILAKKRLSEQPDPANCLAALLKDVQEAVGGRQFDDDITLFLIECGGDPNPREGA